MIPNFCLSFKPSRIPLILHGLPCGFQPIEGPYIVFHLCLFIIIIFSLMLSTFFFLFLSFLPFFSSSLLLFCQIWLQERLQLLHSPIVPLSTYLPRHLRDCRLRDILGFEAYMELMGRLEETDIQWVVEWWHILSMV